MSATSLIKDFDPKRLKLMLGVFFLVLTIPTAVLIWQAYTQLKWESFYQYRNMATELTSRIDTGLRNQITTAENRSFTDYSFLVVAGDPAANFLERSPLSDYPVTEDVPGVIGYFQVGANGEFSTPLLPQEGAAPEQLGIAADEYSNRVKLATEIQQVLADNSLVRKNTAISSRGALLTLAQPPAAALESAEFEEESGAASFDSPVSRSRPLPAEAEPTDRLEVGNELDDSAPAGEVVGRMQDGEAADKDGFRDLVAAPMAKAVGDDEVYSQQVFDNLNRSRDNTEMRSYFSTSSGLVDAVDTNAADPQGLKEQVGQAKARQDTLLEKKSEEQSRLEMNDQKLPAATASAPARSKRVEQSALPEAVLAESPEEVLLENAPGKADLADLRISTFESEVDPYEFSLLGSGHLVMFRKVWRNGERYIQGLLIDQQRFLGSVIEIPFRNTALSGMSNLAIAYEGNAIQTVSGGSAGRYSDSSQDMGGALLYQSRLLTPLDTLELVFSINRLPPGPGAKVLGWTTIVIALVFLGGFYALYRAGMSQITLARQQQDFVSAVSHELKTPLTSIRMYGEMLKEGWADEEKRQQYYGYIHDESERLTRLISNVLQLAKITRNEPQFDMKPRTVGELMSLIESKIASQVKSAGFDLDFRRDEAVDDSTVEIDDDCFSQILINLVDNAIKFSKNADCKRIEISSTPGRGDTVNFAIRDYGPGVPKDQMKKIFKLFYRSESELTRETVGTGIGLAIVHQLTTAMNGKVDVINREPGAEFTITFPGR